MAEELTPQEKLDAIRNEANIRTEEDEEWINDEFEHMFGNSLDS